MKRCNHCGCVNDNINRYCRNCGTAFPEPEPEKKIPAQPASAPISQPEPEPVVAGTSGEPDPFFAQTEIPLSLQSTEKEESVDPFFQLAEQPLPATDASELGTADPAAPAPLFPELPGEADSVSRPGELDAASLAGVIDRSVSETDPPKELSGSYIDFDFNPEQDEPVHIAPTPSDAVRYSTHPVIDTCKRLGASGVFLTYCIAATVNLALRVTSLLQTLPILPDRLRQVMAQTYPGTAVQIEEMASTILPVTAGLACTVLLPAVLCLLGMWMHYAASRNRRRNYLSTKGLSLVRISCIINIVFLGLCAAVVLFLLLSTGLAIPSYPAQEQATLLLGLAVLAIFAFGAMTVGILYFAFALSGIRRIKHTAATGTPNHKLPVFVVVINLLCAMGYSPSLGIALAQGTYLSGITTLCAMAELVLLSVAIIRYRTVMSYVK